MDKALIDQVMQLEPAERLELAQRLFDSVPDDAEDDFELTDELKAELDRRLAEHKRDPSSAVPWEEVRERLRARFG